MTVELLVWTDLYKGEPGSSSCLMVTATTREISAGIRPIGMIYTESLSTALDATFLLLLGLSRLITGCPPYCSFLGGDTDPICATQLRLTDPLTSMSTGLRYRLCGRRMIQSCALGL